MQITKRIKQYIKLVMDKNKGFYFCLSCEQQILVKNSKVHQMICPPKKIVKRKSSLNHPEIKKEKNNKPLPKQQEEGEEEEQDLIPCNICGQVIKLQLYDFHIGQCEQLCNKKCQKCDLQFPDYLLEEHLEVCQGQNEYKNQTKNQFDSSFEQHYPENNEQFNNQIGELAINQENFIPQEKQQVVGLTQAEINSLIKLTKKKTNMECSICYSQISTTMKNAQLKCGHSFHKLCIKPWLLVNPKCPICRKNAVIGI